jgi:hypothetical protein
MDVRLSSKADRRYRKEINGGGVAMDYGTVRDAVGCGAVVGAVSIRITIGGVVEPLLLQ